MQKTILALILSVTPAAAQDIISPQAFEDYAGGKTLYFAQQGSPYGVEQYLPGRQTIWQYADGDCVHGIWFTRGSLICFVYESEPNEQCWHFLKKGKTFAARALGREPAADLDVIWRDDRPIACPGPEIGA